ncbi:MAG: phosphopantetheine-protein transferase [Schlesneria sp.]|nr:phosphopantetheine-protein transferase [Schlesneria sp.]
MTSSDWPPLSEPLPLSQHDVHVIRIPLQVEDDMLDRLKTLLSPEEVARADRFKVPQPRRHFIVCRATLRQLLASCLNYARNDVEFDYGAHGKPALRRTTAAASQIEFSVSHSADQALIAIALDRPIGVDIEQVDPAVRILKLATRFFSPREAAELINLPEGDQLAGFYRGWTSKESYLKATGSGLSFPLNKFSVSLNPHQPARLIEVVDQPAELDRWRIMALDPIPNFAAAVLYEATSAESTTLHQWSLSPRAD